MTGRKKLSSSSTRSGVSSAHSLLRGVHSPARISSRSSGFYPAGLKPLFLLDFTLMFFWRPLDLGIQVLLASRDPWPSTSVVFLQFVGQMEFITIVSSSSFTSSGIRGFLFCPRCALWMRSPHPVHPGPVVPPCLGAAQAPAGLLLHPDELSAIPPACPALPARPGRFAHLGCPT